jgi:hypothetical protein
MIPKLVPTIVNLSIGEVQSPEARMQAFVGMPMNDQTRAMMRAELASIAAELKASCEAFEPVGLAWESEPHHVEVRIMELEDLFRIAFAQLGWDQVR